MSSPSPFKAWWLAARPRTLVAGAVPVTVGSALAFRGGHFHWLPALASLFGALFIQIGTNLANDYFDFKKGADTEARLGPPRATQQGWLSPKSVILGAGACMGMAFALGMYLTSIAGAPILVVGLVSILAGYAYTGGPYPLAYHGLGDAFVFIFFGLVAVGGTYFVQTGTLTWPVLLAAAPVGLLGMALLAVNNVRDQPTDALVGKKTLVVRFGTRFGRGEWLVVVALAFVVPVLLWALHFSSLWVLLAVLAFPFAWPPWKLVRRESGALLNQALAQTAKLQLVFGILYAVGLAL